MDLLPGKALMEVATVLGFGADKHGAHNFRFGRPYSIEIAAALRHIHAFNEGEDYDPETDRSHIAHAAARLLFLLEHISNHPEQDDRFRE